MGMPSGVFRPNAYKGLLGQNKRKSQRPEDAQYAAMMEPLARRLSTGTLGIFSSMEENRLASAENVTGAAQETARRSRPRTRHRKHRHSRSRASSRSGSGDEGAGGERNRRRELILSARPGGTGMVTLFDGTKVKARRVGEGDGFVHDEWGYGLLARAARREEAEAAELQAAQEAAGKAATEQDSAARTSQSSEASPIPFTAEPLSRVPSNASARPPSQPDGTRITTGLGLTMEKAAEIRRRHEEEVAALGWEVIHNVHQTRREAKRQASVSESVKTVGSGTSFDEEGKGTPGKDSGSRTPTDARIRSSAFALTPHSTDDELRLVTSHDEPLQTQPLRPTGRHTRERSTSSASRNSSTSWSRSDKAYMSMLPVDKRKMVDPSISIPAPSPHLPRRPDARGHMVVPLPLAQLGRRPMRPREGRSWNIYESVLSQDSPEPTSEDEEFLRAAGLDGSETDSESAHGKGDAAGYDEEESDADDLDPAEAAEEERKTAMQKKRATTKAAGQEIIQRKSTNASLRPSRRLEPTPAVDDIDSWWEPARSGTSRMLSSRRGNGSRAIPVRSTPLRTSVSAHMLSQSAEAISPLRNSVSTESFHATEPRPKPIKNVTLEGLPSASGSSRQEISDDLRRTTSLDGSGKRASKHTRVRPTHQAQARAAYEQRLREARLRERKRLENRKYDDDFIDYGWPRSFISSLY